MTRSKRSLNSFAWLRRLIAYPRIWYLSKVKGVIIADEVEISLSATVVAGRRGAVTIGTQTSVAPLAVIDARRMGGGIDPIVIGDRCFIGGNAILLPGTRIGDGTIVAAGAQVSGAVPRDCIVAGNPARVVRRGVNVGRFGRLPVTDVQRRLLDTLHGA